MMAWVAAINNIANKAIEIVIKSNSNQILQEIRKYDIIIHIVTTIEVKYGKLG